MKMELGVMVLITENINIKESFEEAAKLGMRTCQVSCTAELMIDKLEPKDIRRASEEFGIEISSFFLVFEGQIYNRIKGVSTVGFIPEEYRTRRFKLAEKFSDMIYEMFQ